MKITVKEINTETGEEIIFEREETPEEIISREKAQLERSQKQAEAEAKAVQRAELLSKLGITEEEARILLG